MTTTLFTIALTMLKEAGMAIIKRLPWAALIERLLTRLALWALYKLAGKETNDLKTDTVGDFAAALKGKRLPAAEPPG